MVGRTGGRTEESNVSTTSGAAGVYPQAGWKAAAVRGAHYPGSDGANGGGVWFSNRYSRPICSRNSTPIGKTAVHWTP